MQKKSKSPPKKPKSQQQKDGLFPNEAEPPEAGNVPSANELYPWMVENNAWLFAHGGLEIDSVEHEKIAVVDQYLKMCLDGVAHCELPGLQGLVSLCGNSPLQALFRMAEAKAVEAGANCTPLLSVIVERLRDDLELKETYLKGHGGAKSTAYAQLRQRGLIK
jgi:hypothetical protein